MLSSSIDGTTASTAQHSTAQPSHPCTKQQTKYVSIRIHIKITIILCTCVRRPRCFPGALRSWHLQVACLHQRCWTVYCTINGTFVIPIHSLWVRVAGETARCAKRLVLCTRYFRIRLNVCGSIFSATTEAVIMMYSYTCMWVKTAVFVVYASLKAKRGCGNSSGEGEEIVAATRTFV